MAGDVRDVDEAVSAGDGDVGAAGAELDGTGYGGLGRVVGGRAVWGEEGICDFEGESEGIDVVWFVVFELEETLVESFVQIAEIVEVSTVSGFAGGRVRTAGEGPLEEEEWGEMDVDEDSFVEAFADDAAHEFEALKEVAHRVTVILGVLWFPSLAEKFFPLFKGSGVGVEEVLVILHEHVEAGHGVECFTGDACEELLGHTTAVDTFFGGAEFVNKANLDWLFKTFIELVQLIEGVVKDTLSMDAGSMATSVRSEVPHLTIRRAPSAHLI